jgi:glycosyltransferase involved in cell wall biosynthesis
MSNKVLNIFTIDFPYGSGESFLKHEIDILSKEFDKIVVFPMNFKDTTIKYDLPNNIEIKHENIFEPYNRLSVLSKNIFLIAGIFLNEVFNSGYSKYYIFYFKKQLNILLHRINAANKLGLQFNSSQNHLVYTYWFTQWTLIFSLINHKQKNVALYTRIHGMDVYEDQHTEKNFFFPFRILQSKQIKQVLAISENGKQHLVKMSPQFKDKVIVNRLGVLHTALNPVNRSNEFVLVSCSSFQKYKRVELIVEALKKVDLKIKWIHFGDSEERAIVESAIKDIPSNVLIELRGYVTNQQLMDFYKNDPVDLFINVSETEGIPVSIMEAMSFGIPCIATNVGGVNEIVNYKNGFLIEKNFANNIIADTIKIHNGSSASTKEAFRTEAFNTWASKFDQKKNCKELIEVLK